MAESFYGGRAGHDFTIYYCYESPDEMKKDFGKVDSHTPIGGYCLDKKGNLYRRMINNEALYLGNAAIMGITDLQNTFLYRDGANIILQPTHNIPTKILTMENEKFAYCGISGGTDISVSMEDNKIKINHNSKSFIPTTAPTKTLIYGSEFEVPILGYDEQGHVSSKLTQKYKLPAAISYSAGTGISLNNNTISLNIATDSSLGGIKTGYTESEKNYAVKLDRNRKAYVTVPWENTTYSIKNAVAGGTEVSLVTTGEKALWNGKQDDLLFDTGTTNGTFKYRPYTRPNWSSVEIKGLGSAAYTNTDAYLASNITTLNLDTLIGRQIGSASSILQGAINNSTVAITVGKEEYLFGTDQSFINAKTLHKDHSLVFHGALPWMWKPSGNWKVETINSMITAYIVGLNQENTPIDIIPIHPNDIDASGSYTITYTPSTDLRFRSIQVRSEQSEETQPTGTIPPGASWSKVDFSSNTKQFQSYYVCDNSAVNTYIKSVQKLFKKLLEKAEFTEEEIKRI